MDTTQIIFASIVGLIVQYALIYFAIHNAMVRQRQHDRIQTDLLARIAKKAGVTDQEIQEAYNK